LKAIYNLWKNVSYSFRFNNQSPQKNASMEDPQNLLSDERATGIHESKGWDISPKSVSVEQEQWTRTFKPAF